LVNNGAATIGEALAGLEFPLGPHASIRLGYQVLWFQGVALAVDQDYLALMSGGVDVAQAMAIYQGGFIGFEAAF
jgi:hypothetical protein